MAMLQFALLPVTDIHLCVLCAIVMVARGAARTPSRAEGTLRGHAYCGEIAAIPQRQPEDQDSNTSRHRWHETTSGGSEIGATCEVTGDKWQRAHSTSGRNECNDGTAACFMPSYPPTFFPSGGERRHRNGGLTEASCRILYGPYSTLSSKACIFSSPFSYTCTARHKFQPD
jgi:hypothetical protein